MISPFGSGSDVVIGAGVRWSSARPSPGSDEHDGRQRHGGERPPAAGCRRCRTAEARPAARLGATTRRTRRRSSASGGAGRPRPAVPSANVPAVKPRQGSSQGRGSARCPSPATASTGMTATSTASVRRSSSVRPARGRGGDQFPGRVERRLQAAATRQQRRHRRDAAAPATAGWSKVRSNSTAAQHQRRRQWPATAATAGGDPGTPQPPTAHRTAGRLRDPGGDAVGHPVQQVPGAAGRCAPASRARQSAQASRCASTAQTVASSSAGTAGGVPGDHGRAWGEWS